MLFIVSLLTPRFFNFGAVGSKAVRAATHTGRGGPTVTADPRRAARACSLDALVYIAQAFPCHDRGVPFVGQVQTLTRGIVPHRFIICSLGVSL